VLLGFLVAAGVYAVDAWRSLSGVAISGGWRLFLVLGVVFTLAVGGGLMALVFYSSRHDYDGRYFLRQGAPTFGKYLHCRKGLFRLCVCGRI